MALDVIVISLRTLGHVDVDVTVGSHQLQIDSDCCDNKLKLLIGFVIFKKKFLFIIFTEISTSYNPVHLMFLETDEMLL